MGLFILWCCKMLFVLSHVKPRTLAKTLWIFLPTSKANEYLSWVVNITFIILTITHKRCSKWSPSIAILDSLWHVLVLEYVEQCSNVKFLQGSFVIYSLKKNCSDNLKLLLGTAGIKVGIPRLHMLCNVFITINKCTIIYHNSISLYNVHSYMFWHFSVINREFYICALLSYVILKIEAVKATVP